MRPLHLEGYRLECDRFQAQSISQTRENALFWIFCSVGQSDMMPAGFQNLALVMPEIEILVEQLKIFKIQI